MWPTAGIHELHIKEGLIERNVNRPFPKKDKLIAGGPKCLPKGSRGFFLSRMLMFAFIRDSYGCIWYEFRIIEFKDELGETN